MEREGRREKWKDGRIEEERGLDVEKGRERRRKESADIIDKERVKYSEAVNQPHGGLNYFIKTRP